MKKLSILDIAGLTIILILIAFTLAPAVARMQRTASETTCQGNMNILANAIAEYCADYGGKYPTNRIVLGTSITSEVPLSTPPGSTGSGGTPLRFQYGINWVEALYPYVQARETKTARPYKSVFICPNASTNKYHVNSNAAVTYAFNANLVEHSSQLNTIPNKLMMIRELDRLYNSVLRPTNDSGNLSSNLPVSPFLDTVDEAVSQINQRSSTPNQHSTGSYILFADGHVGYFTTDYFPDQDKISSVNCWDTETQQWWNYNNSNTNVPDYMRRTIAITP